MNYACKAINKIYIDPLRVLSLNYFLSPPKNAQFGHAVEGKCRSGTRPRRSDLMPTAYLISHNFLVRDPIFVKLTKYRTTKAEARDPLTTQPFLSPTSLYSSSLSRSAYPLPSTYSALAIRCGSHMNLVRFSLNHYGTYCTPRPHVIPLANFLLLRTLSVVQVKRFSC